MLKTHSQIHSSNVEIQMVNCEIRPNLTPKICFIFFHTISTYRDDKQKPIGFATRSDLLSILRQIHRTFYVKSHKIPIFYNILKVLISMIFLLRSCAIFVGEMLWLFTNEYSQFYVVNSQTIFNCELLIHTRVSTALKQGLLSAV